MDIFWASGKLSWPPLRMVKIILRRLHLYNIK